MSDPFNLSKQRLEELRLAWSEVKWLRKIKTDKFNLKEFLFVLKTLGIDMSKRDMWILQQEYQMRGSFRFEDLVHVGSIAWTEEALEESLLTALEVLDPQRTGNVGVYDLRQLLYKLGIGIRLTLSEIDVFLEQFEEMHTGLIPIDKLVLRMLAD